MTEDKKDMDIDIDKMMESKPKKPKKKKKVSEKKTSKMVEQTDSNAVVKSEKVTDLVSPEEDAVALPSSPNLISKLKESVFEEGLHYIVNTKKDTETVFFKKQASSVLAELFNVNVRIVNTKVESFIPPNTKYIVDEVFESIRKLISEGKMKVAGGLLEWAKDLTQDKNPAEWWRAEVVLEADNGKRKLQWTGSATNALENVALSTAITRAFRNLIRIFGGL